LHQWNGGFTFITNDRLTRVSLFIAAENEFGFVFVLFIAASGKLVKNSQKSGAMLA